MFSCKPTMRDTDRTCRYAAVLAVSWLLTGITAVFGQDPAYWMVPVQGGIYTGSISDSGVLVGSAWSDFPVGSGTTPAVLPPQIIDGEPQYLPDDLRLLPDVDGTQQFGVCRAMNAMGVAVGYVTDVGPTHRALLWLPDGTAVNLGVDPAGLGSGARDINDAGVVLVGIGQENAPDEHGGVVVPLDEDGDGAPDTWFTDEDGDGMNDLYFRTDAGHNLLPLVINEAGQELAAQYAGGKPVTGYLLTPDFTDADGDGNPWFADENGDGFNDLLVALEPPVPGASVAVAGLNNLGQVAGNSGGHVLRWEFVDGVQIVTDLGSLSDRLNMTVRGISDSGRIVGTSWQDTGRRTKDGPSWLIENDTLYELLPLVVNADQGAVPIAINAPGWICGSGWVAVPIEPSPPPACGDDACDPGEDECNCPADCGVPPVTETSCTDGVDNDCDGLVDCDDTDDCGSDPSCDCAAKGDACASDSDCCSNDCKSNGTCR